MKKYLAIIFVLLANNLYSSSGRMIIWGGRDNYFFTNTGGIYDPATNSWTLTTTTGAPFRRSHNTAVWTGPPPASTYEEFDKIELNLDITPNIAKAKEAIHIKYTMDGDFTLAISDIAGRVQIIEKGNKKGKYELTYDTKNLTQGIYFIQLNTEKKKITKKLIVI